MFAECFHVVRVSVLMHEPEAGLACHDLWTQHCAVYLSGQERRLIIMSRAQKVTSYAISRSASRTVRSETSQLPGKCSDTSNASFDPFTAPCATRSTISALRSSGGSP